MSLSRRIARPLLASIFIAEGWDAIRHPDGKGHAVEFVTPPPTEGGPFVREDTLTLVRVNGIVQIGGGVLLAIGKFPRLASLALIGSIVPTTYAGHRFWEETDETKRAQQRVQLFKNLGLLGGLIYAAVDTDGAPSIEWRTRRRVRQVATAVSEKHAASGDHAHQAASKAADSGRNAGRRAQRAAKRATRRANASAAGVAHQASEIATSAAKTGAVLASPYLRQANEGAVETAQGALDFVAPYVSAGFERAGEFIEGALDEAGPYISEGFERAGEIIARIPTHPSFTDT